MPVKERDPVIQEYLRQQVAEEEREAEHAPKDAPPERPPREEKSPSGKGSKRRPLLRKTRAGVPLSKGEIRAIRAGRKKLRRELRQRGLKSRSDFESTAASLGLYFDGHHGLWAFLLSHWLPALLASLMLLLTVIFIFAAVTRMRGHYTVNLSEGMFNQGFILSDNVEFEHATTNLFANPAENVPCISIRQIPVDVDQTDGEHNDTYCAYTYYIRNEGDDTVGYTWSLDVISESQDLTEALWVILFVDGEMRIYAKADSLTGGPEALPALDDDTRGYPNLPIQALAPDSDQFEVITTRGNVTWWRVIPDTFLSDTCVTQGEETAVAPMEVHKYTVVMYLEGDDPQANDDKIGAHAGLQMDFRLKDEPQEGENQGGVIWEEFLSRLKFW